MEVIDQPFRGSEALSAGRLSRRALFRDYRPVYRNVYLARDRALTPATKARAAWLWSNRTGTLAGLSAAAMLGCGWIDTHHPAELFRRNGKPVTGIVIHRGELAADEVCRVEGVAVTSPARTAFDLGRRRGLAQAVIRLDALSRATGFRRCDVEELLVEHHGARGAAQLRRALALMDGGAESPQETRTRLILVGAGLPTPTTQILVYDDCEHPIARVDMGWEEWKVGVEFDGAQHWTDPAQRTRDINRLAELEACGWGIVRVSGELLHQAPGLVVDRALAALRAAGCPVERPVDARFRLPRVS